VRRRERQVLGGLVSVCSLFVVVVFAVPADHISVLPLGQVSPVLLTKLETALSVTFDVPLDRLRPEELPPVAYNAMRGQYNSAAVLDYLVAEFSPKPPAATSFRPGRLLAVTESDLYADSMSYVFGEADPANRVCIVSLARLGEVEVKDKVKSPLDLNLDLNLLCVRAIRESVHELGHTYGLAHCSDPTCVMHFSHSLEESDRRSCNFCPDCRRKLKEFRSSGVMSSGVQLLNSLTP
jgi:archaemetzincin